MNYLNVFARRIGSLDAPMQLASASKAALFARIYTYLDAKDHKKWQNYLLALCIFLVILPLNILSETFEAFTPEYGENMAYITQNVHILIKIIAFCALLWKLVNKIKFLANEVDAAIPDRYRQAYSRSRRIHDGLLTEIR